MMRSLIASLIAAICVANAAPLAVRQFPANGDNIVAGSSGIDDTTVNSGALAQGTLSDNQSFDGSSFSDFIGNDITRVNQNAALHDNIIENANANIAEGSTGPVAVGNGNSVLPISTGPFVTGGGFFPPGAFFKRQVGGSTGLSNVEANSGAMKDGTIDAGLSFDGAGFGEAVGNDFEELNQNSQFTGNNMMDPNWNSATNNDGPVLAGNDGTQINVNNQAGAINFDNDRLFEILYAAGMI